MPLPQEDIITNYAFTKKNYVKSCMCKVRLEE